MSTCKYCIHHSDGGFWWKDTLPRCTKMIPMKVLPNKEIKNVSGGISNVVDDIQCPEWCPLNGAPVVRLASYIGK